MPIFEVIYKIQKTYQVFITADNEEEANKRAIDSNLNDDKHLHVYPDDVWIASITEVEE